MNQNHLTLPEIKDFNALSDALCCRLNGFRSNSPVQICRASSPLRGPVFQDANTLLRGAAEGQGVVIGWLALIGQDSAEGRVVRLFDEDILPTHGYFIETRGGSSHRKELPRTGLGRLVSLS